MAGTIKAYALVYACMILLVLGAPNKRAYTTPQCGESIDSRLIFNSTVVEQMKEFDSTLSRIRAKRDTIVEFTKELRMVTSKVKTNEPKGLTMDTGRHFLPTPYAVASEGMQ